jgi:hypothetical protein
MKIISQPPELPAVEELKKLEKKLVKEKHHAFKRHPLLFALLVTFGTAITFNGIGRLITKVPFLYENPLVTILFGLLILLFTGTLYKNL